MSNMTSADTYISERFVRKFCAYKWNGKPTDPRFVTQHGSIIDGMG